MKDNRAGGWAWAVTPTFYASGYVPNSTNQTMEMQAALEALTVLEGDVEVISDSAYVVNCFLDGWYKVWLANDWKTSKNKPVSNRQIWEPLIQLYIAREHEVTWTKVKGHSGNVMNDFVDKLAVAARITKQDSFEYE